jgi:O-antigen/teichoic acid export membrane protein
MSTGQRIIKNSIFLTFSQVFAKIINFGLILILTRMLGRDGFGLYSYSFAYVSIFMFLTHLGIINLQVREIAKYKDQASDILGNTFPIVIILSTGFLLLVNILPFFFEWNKNEHLISFVLSFYFIFDTLGRYFLGIMRAFERMEFEAVITVSERLLLLIASLLSWYLDYSLLVLVILFTIILGLKALVSFQLASKRFVQFHISFSFDRTLEILRQAYPFALVGLFATVIARVDMLILKSFHSIDSVAVYGAARKIIESLAFIPESIYYAVFPAMSLMYLHKNNKFNQLFHKTILMMLVIAIPVSTGIFILAPQIVNLLFESEFSDASIALRWLSIVLAFMFVRQSFAVVLNAVGKQHLFALIFGIAMIANIALNFLLIPQYELFGASMAAIISEFIVLIISFPFLLKYVHFANGISLLFRLTLVGIITAILIYVIQTWNLLLIVIIIATVYIVLLILFRIITLVELKEISLIFSKKFQ